MSSNGEKSGIVSVVLQSIMSDWSHDGDNVARPWWSPSPHLWANECQVALQRMAALLVLLIALASAFDLYVRQTTALSEWGLQAVAVVVALLATVSALLRPQDKHVVHVVLGTTALLYITQAIYGVPSQVLWLLPITVSWSVVLPSWVVVGPALFAVGLTRWLVPEFSTQLPYVMLVLAGLLATHVLKSQLLRLGDLAFFDALTGTLNRRLFPNHAARLMAEYKREGRPAALVYIDLDAFKAINDRLGHDVGDRVLKAFASLLQQRVRKTDLLYRMGGDEFVLVLSNTQFDNVPALVADLQLQLSEIDTAAPHTISACFGVSSIQHAQNVADWMAAADHALRDAKARGPGNVQEAQV